VGKAKGKEKVSGSGSLKVTVKTPAAPPFASRGFYQVEEDALYVPIYPGGKFFSFLDSPQVTLDVDPKGRLLFVQILVARHSWQVRPDISPPVNPPGADVRFLDFRDKIPDARVETSADHSLAHVIFGELHANRSYRVADNLIVDLTADNTLAAIWVTAIEDDRAARAMAEWRKEIRETYDKQGPDSHLTRIEIDR